MWLRTTSFVLFAGGCLLLQMGGSIGQPEKTKRERYEFSGERWSRLAEALKQAKLSDERLGNALTKASNFDSIILYVSRVNSPPFLITSVVVKGGYKEVPDLESDIATVGSSHRDYKELVAPLDRFLTSARATEMVFRGKQLDNLRRSLQDVRLTDDKLAELLQATGESSHVESIILTVSSPNSDPRAIRSVKVEWTEVGKSKVMLGGTINKDAKDFEDFTSALNRYLANKQP